MTKGRRASECRRARPDDEVEALAIDKVVGAVSLSAEMNHAAARCVGVNAACPPVVAAAKATAEAQS